MAEVKTVERLEDWFDSLVIIGFQGAGDTWARLAPAGLSVHRTTLAGADDPQALYAALERLRREEGIKRPLVWVFEDVSTAAAVGAGEAFKVRFLEGAAPPNAINAMNAYDLTVSTGAVAQAEGRVLDLAPSESSMATLVTEICARIQQGVSADKSLNVLILYCDVFTHIETIHEHLRAFSRYSRHNYFYFPVSDTTRLNMFEGYAEAWPQAWDLSVFDAVIWHYVVPAYLEGRISPFVADKLAAYDGLKILFVQDEYDSTATTWDWIRKAGVQLVMTCVPPEGLAYAYPPQRHHGVEFLQTLTGYVPEDDGLERFVTPMRRRDMRLAYRGRILPYRYGLLGREKYDIGVQMKALAQARGVAADIAVDEDSRIYGQDWYRFLGSARAMLATESGSNIFDFEGTLKPLGEAAEQRGESFESFHAQHLQPHEGHVRMNQISPKVFEAISLRTALVCFEGVYSGVIQPDIHYIPLKKDYSNVDDVFAKLEDLDLLEEMTERAFRDVIASGRYSYAAFARNFEAVLESRVMRQGRVEMISVPLMYRRPDAPGFTGVVRPTAFEQILNTGVLRGDFRRRNFEILASQIREAELTPRLHQGDRPPPSAVATFSADSGAVVCYDFWRNAGATLQHEADGAHITTPPVCWHYASGINLDFSGVDFDHEHCWVRVRVRDATSNIRVSVYDLDDDTLAAETALPVGPGESEVFLKIVRRKGSLLLFRTGEFPEAASATILSAEILVSSAYHPSVLAVAQALKHTPSRWVQ
jgi:hypothetical protein